MSKKADGYNEAFDLGESPVTHLHIRAPENAASAIFGILRKTAFPSLTHMHIQLHQTLSERHVHEFDPANPGLYAVHRDLAQRLKNVIIQTDGWRNKDHQWYEQLAALFGPANRDDVMVMNIPDQHFPTQIEGNSDSSGSSEMMSLRLAVILTDILPTM
jgi:hypothetical protein